MIAAIAYKAIAADYIARMRARGLEPFLMEDDRLAFECDEGTPLSYVPRLLARALRRASSVACQRDRMSARGIAQLVIARGQARSSPGTAIAVKFPRALSKRRSAIVPSRTKGARPN